MFRLFLKQNSSRSFISLNLNPSIKKTSGAISGIKRAIMFFLASGLHRSGCFVWRAISGIPFSLSVKPHSYGFDSFVESEFFMP